MKQIALTLFVAVLVAGCAPRMLSKTEESIAFKVNTGPLSNHVEEATTQASNHCAQYGRRARLEGINDMVATFHCID